MTADNTSRFSPNLFWDTDTSSIDLEKNARFVVERVLMHGRMRDWETLKALYGLDRIKKEALQIRYLDQVTLHFCSMLFNEPISKFRCSKQPQSIQQLWPY